MLTQPALLHQLVDGHICFLYGAQRHRLASAQTRPQCCTTTTTTAAAAATTMI